MFDLCNQIAYNKLMVNGVHRALGDPAAPDVFDGPEGSRIYPSHWFDEPGDQGGSHLQPGQIERLERAIEYLLGKGLEPSDIIVISPFRVVADKLRELHRQVPEAAGRDDPYRSGPRGACRDPRPGR